jgi:hypothetical protein
VVYPKPQHCNDASAKRPIKLWATLATFQSCKVAKDTIVHPRGRRDYKKRPRVEFFFSAPRGRPTYYVIRNKSIYGNSDIIAMFFSTFLRRQTGVAEHPLCVLSALSSETAGLNLSYGEVIRSRTDLCTQKSYFGRSSVGLDGQYRCC